MFLIEPGYQGCLNAKKRGLANVYNLVFQQFDFKANNVHAIGLYDVLEHIEDDVSFLIDLKKKLPRGSILYITVPTHMYLWSDIDILGGHVRRYNKKMIKKLCQETDLELTYFSYFFSYLPVITFLLRRIPYKLRGMRNQTEILSVENENHNPSNFILKFFNFFHRIELRKMKKSKISLGASCIVVLKT